MCGYVFIGFINFMLAGKTLIEYTNRIYLIEYAK